MKKRLIYFFVVIFILFGIKNAVAQDIDGVWTGNFIQYIHNSYDVQMTVKKLPPGNIFSARLRITDSYYFGEYNISGYICNKKNIEISTIVLLRESGASSWIDCLNGTFDLNDDETELTFTDTWIEQGQRNNTCKLKYIQKDMFQCLRSAYLHKAKYQSEIAEFDKLWEKATLTKKLNKDALDEMLANTQPKNNKQEQGKTDIALKNKIDTVKLIAQHKNETSKETKDDIAEKVEAFNKTETKIVAKNEDRTPVIDTFETIKHRKVIVKDEIEVSNDVIIIEYWDRYTEDGDSVNIFLNKKPILENVLLTKAKKSITVKLEKTKNYLVLDAINEGKEPPNTASITVKDGKKIQNVSLTSTMKTSGALKIILKK